ncbi:MAG: hypothetical protein EOP41_02360 [Sphingobacteriaceae bacterium]|nr:MAG: hypothetical protein EOP41_02360 [Sphingobacteriaceae bacterium]
MKKHVTLIVSLFLFYTIATAQTQKGNQLLGGNISFLAASGTSDYSNFNNPAYNYSNKNKTTSFGIGPVYSYFLADQLDLGVTLNYGTSITTFNYSAGNPTLTTLPNKISNQSYIGGVYLRKYFLYKQKAGIRTGPFAEYQRFKYNNEYLGPQTNYNNIQSGNSISAGLGLDLVYFPTSRFGIFANLGAVNYTHYTTEYQYFSDLQSNKANSFGLRLTTALNLSLVYSFH